MNIEEIHNYCLQKVKVKDSMPFGDSVVVYKVCGKVFLLLSINDNPLQFNVKCNPEKALELREQYENVIPGYHMNKKHWNTVIIDGSVSNYLLKEWIDDSYNLIVKGLSKKERLGL